MKAQTFNVCVELAVYSNSLKCFHSYHSVDHKEKKKPPPLFFCLPGVSCLFDFKTNWEWSLICTLELLWSFLKILFLKGCLLGVREQKRDKRKDKLTFNIKWGCLIASFQHWFFTDFYCFFVFFLSLCAFEQDDKTKLVVFLLVYTAEVSYFCVWRSL